MKQKKSKVVKIWHYTVASHYNQIIADGFIKLATLYVNKNEKPAVWLSSNPNYEETVRKTLRDSETGEVMKDLSRDELFEKGVLPVRLEINSSFIKLHTWEDFQKESRINHEVADTLVKVAEKWGAYPEDWYTSFEPISTANGVLSVECWDGKEWVLLNSEDTKAD